MKAMKFRIKNKFHSKAIQQRLFELGYSWEDDIKDFSYLKAPFLFARNSGRIEAVYDAFYFEQSFTDETTLEDLYEEEVSDTVTNEVIQDIKDRREAGLKKYGTTLDRKDLTKEEWLNHAYEEALDLACYLKKIKRLL